MKNPIYRIQESRYNSAWMEVSNVYPHLSNAKNADAWIAIAKDMDSLGKYSFRVIDDAGKIYWTAKIPYEGVSLNLAAPNWEWLNSIRQDYGIDLESWTDACEQWLAKSKEW